MKEMKRIILTTALVLFTLTSHSKPTDFESMMKSKLEILRSVNEDIDFKELGDEFAKIYKKNKERFEPLYYSAFCHIMSSWQQSDPGSKIKILEKSIEQINRAKELTVNNDELLVIEALYYQAMILVNPVKYGQSLSVKAEELLRKAQAMNKNNPRAKFLRAQNLYYRPEQFGGGKEKALPLFEKAAELFDNQDTDNYLQPVWGSKTNNEMLEICKK